tara:strand:- start:1884 stop:2126 length:243 start_codon:yes stop_codon:yes gene_type:complete
MAYSQDYCEEPSSIISNDFIINKNNNLACQYKRHTDSDQVPFILSVPGPLSLRKGPDSDNGVNKPYTVTISTDPQETSPS